MQSTKAIFSERLKEMLELREKSQAQLAKELNTTPQAISSYVKGKTTPDYDMLYHMANRLGVSIDYLLGNTNAITSEEQELIAQDNMDDYLLRTFRRFAVIRDKMRALYRDHFIERGADTSLTIQFVDELNAVCSKYNAISEVFGYKLADHPEMLGEFDAFNAEFPEKLNILMQDASFHTPATEPAIICELIHMERVLK